MQHCLRYFTKGFPCFLVLFLAGCNREAPFLYPWPAQVQENPAIQRKPTCELKLSGSTSLVGDPFRITVSVEGAATDLTLDGQMLKSAIPIKEWVPQTAGTFRSEAIVRGPGGASSCSARYEFLERAPTCQLEASPASSLVGETVTLTLKTGGKVTGADIAGVKAAFPLGTTTVTSVDSGVFPVVATVRGPGGTGTCQVSYVVRDRAPTCKLAASPKSIQLGESLDLEIDGAGKISAAFIEGASVTFPKGVKNLKPAQPGTFTAKAWVDGPGGRGDCQVSYEVRDLPPTCTLTATPAKVPAGKSVALALVGNGAITKATIDGTSVVFPKGLKTVVAGSPGTYTVKGEVFGPGGQGSCTAVYSVNAAPTCTLVAAPALALPGTEVTVSMTTTGDLTSATIDGKAVSLPTGEIKVKQSASGKYVAHGEVDGPDGKATCDANYGATISHTITKTIKEINVITDLDMLWVIDNSGSMGSHQQAVKDNMDSFIQEYVKVAGLKWKMGLISTDASEKPYLGFTLNDLFTYKTPDPVTTFNQAVAKLGTSGSSTEETFKPVMTAIDNNPDFLRKDAGLAIITVTDAPEQSTETAADFVKYLVGKKGDIKLVFGYGILGPKDFNCTDTDDAWNYKGSKYEEYITATNGKAVPICEKDFGKAMLSIAQTIINSQVLTPKILLGAKPVPGTIQVRYRGRLLPEGPKASGGIWVYDSSDNSVSFHDLAFATGQKEVAEVTFQEAP